MNQQIVDYLQTNKDSYTQESLVAQLRNVGHKEEEIQEAVNVVYGINEESKATAKSTTKEQVKKQNNVHYAGFWIRWVAMFIDGLVLIIPNGIIIFIFSMIAPALTMLSTVIVFVVTLLYFAIMTDKYQATLGKMAVGIRVCDANSLQKAQSKSIWIREFVNRIILFIQPLFLLEIIAGFTKRKQGVHDMTAKTVVAYKDPNKKMSGGVIAAIVIIATFVIIAMIGLFASIVLVSLNSARDTAKDASAQASISSTVPAAILCIDNKSNLNAPVVGESICNMSDGVWPAIEGGEWGILIDGNVSDENFKYTATYGENNKQAVCTEMGCNFLDDTY